MQRGWWWMEMAGAGDSRRRRKEHGIAGSAEGGERGWWRMERGGRWQRDGRTVRQGSVDAYDRHIISSRDTSYQGLLPVLHRRQLLRHCYLFLSWVFDNMGTEMAIRCFYSN